MILRSEQAEYFYRLWIPLLDFVNRNRKIDKNLYGMTSPKGLPIETVRKFRDALWEDRKLLDEYARQNPNHLSATDLEIVAGWKNAVCDSFAVLRHLKSGSIFLPMHRSDKAYIVCGIYSTWEEMFRGVPLPQVIDTVLLPFGDRIIYDSIIVSPHVRLGGNIKRSLEDQYRNIKAAGGVYKSLDNALDENTHDISGQMAAPDLDSNDKSV